MKASIRQEHDARAAQKALLHWYQTEGRVLPWRREKPDPYHVLLSEFMLQQTTVAAVKPYFARFLERWPSIQALANSPDDEVMKEWAGLGYYARARNLLKAAREIARLGEFPRREEDLRKLSGVGPYTAAAIAAIAFGEEILPLDGNIKRILARLYCLDEEIEKTGPELRAIQARWAHSEPSALAQAMMDLGAMICRAKNPKCAACPIAKFCCASQRGETASYPKRMPRRAKKIWRAHAYILETTNGIGFVKRPENGLLGGMWALPCSPWGEKSPFAPPINGDWQGVGEIRHIFTHIDLRLGIWYLRTDEEILSNKISIFDEVELPRSALPSLWRKALEKKGN